MREGGVWRGLGLLLCVGLLGAAPPPKPKSAPASLMRGVFSGHGIARPKSAKRRAKARALAQRLGARCKRLVINEVGVGMPQPVPCRARKPTRDDVAAIFDRLDEVTPSHHTFWADATATQPLLDALVAVGRKDVVPVLIEALDRLATRHAHAAHFEIDWRDAKRMKAVEGALERMTFHRVERFEDGRGYPASARPPKLDHRQVAARWRVWWKTYGNERPASWRRAAIKRARAKVASADSNLRVLGILDLHAIATTRREARKLAREMVKDHPKRRDQLEPALK